MIRAIALAASLISLPAAAQAPSVKLVDYQCARGKLSSITVIVPPAAEPQQLTLRFPAQLCLHA